MYIVSLYFCCILLLCILLLYIVAVYFRCILSLYIVAVVCCSYILLLYIVLFPSTSAKHQKPFTAGVSFEQLSQLLTIFFSLRIIVKQFKIGKLNSEDNRKKKLALSCVKLTSAEAS